MKTHDEFFAVYTCQQAEQLVRYDHHRVRINGRLGIMLTYHWLPLEDAAETLLLKVVFHDSASQHPPTPPEIQALVEQLTFEARSLITQEITDDRTGS